MLRGLIKKTRIKQSASKPLLNKKEALVKLENGDSDSDSISSESSTSNDRGVTMATKVGEAVLYKYVRK